ncbi:MAG TPA: hypothetical protein VMU76_08335 [Acidimicrobiales bacterium]|nr:hypothetical protein [Acidimicrobiales bacterium]
MTGPVFRHVDDVPWHEVRAQLHGDRRVAARLKFVESGGAPTVLYTEYDPGLVLEAHGHGSDHVVFVLQGSVRIGEVDCTPGTTVLLGHGATFGPLVAGPDGTRLLEFYTGDVTPVPADPEGYEELLRARGIVRVPADIQRGAPPSSGQ